jgi:hypothetical protein
MDFNERFITGPDNQGPWPLLGPASVYFHARDYPGPGELMSKEEESWREEPTAFPGQKHESPDSQSGLPQAI